MRVSIDETMRRRQIQMEYNKEHGITPTTVRKSKEAILEQTKVADSKKEHVNYYVEDDHVSVAADPVVQYMDAGHLDKLMKEVKKKMEAAAKDLDFIMAAKYRDELAELKQMKANK